MAPPGAEARLGWVDTWAAGPDMLDVVSDADLSQMVVKAS